MKASVKFMFFVPVAVAVAYYSWYFYTNMEKEKTLSDKEWEVLFDVLDRLNLWRKIISNRQFTQPKKFLLGTNVNLDLIVSFRDLRKEYNMTAVGKPDSSDVIHSFDEFMATFSFYFSQGAAAERFVSDKDVFDNLTRAAQNVPHRMYIGGNAALMADFLARLEMNEVSLYGPVGTQLRPLLSPQLLVDSEVKVDQPDEIHMIIEYEAEEKFFELTSPIANRFIIHHDMANTKLTHVTGFLGKLSSNDKFDWTVWSGLHFLDSLQSDGYMPHLLVFRKTLENRQSGAPLHLELASMANEEYVRNLYDNVVRFADSIGLNDQELMFISKCIGGPKLESSKVIDGMVRAMVWILAQAREKTKQGRFLTRIHMHSHRYHVIAVSKREQWFGTADGLLNGAYIAAVRACRSEEPMDFDLSKPKFSNKTELPNPADRHPVTTWLEDGGRVQIYAVPTIFCRQPKGTVGLGDAISAASLIFNSLEPKLRKKM